MGGYLDVTTLYSQVHFMALLHDRNIFKQIIYVVQYNL